MTLPARKTRRGIDPREAGRAAPPSGLRAKPAARVRRGHQENAAPLVGHISGTDGLKAQIVLQGGVWRAGWFCNDAGHLGMILPPRRFDWIAERP